MKQALGKVLTNPVIWISALYLILPVDLVEDSVPVAGTLDDLLVFVLSSFIQELFRGNSNNTNNMNR